MPTMPAEQFGRSIDPPAGVAAPGGGGGGGVTPPLWLEETNTTQVTVRSGTVNGINPTGVATPITVSGTDGTWYIYLNATLTSAGTVSTVAVSTSTVSVPASTSTNAYYQIGMATVSSSLITAVSPTLAWSQTFVACTPGDPDSYNWVVA